MATSAVNYRETDATLPDMGASALGPQSMKPSDASAIMACESVPALAQMSAYAQSYFATAGGIVMGSVGAITGLALGRRSMAIVSALGAGASALITIEARRRARQWEAVIQARITELALGD